ncbi:MAG: rod shape-determining protein [Christensenellaceae bacterium]|nr:rod shape-determining protein [Christensenellaceae bacterium]
MALITRDIGIDLGTSNSLMHVRGRGIVLSEPSIVAVDEQARAIIAVGSEAQKMMGRTPKNVSVIRPLRGGVISDYDLTERMLHYYLRRVLGRFSLTRPHVVVSVPSGITEVERRSVVEALLDAGAGDVRLILEPLAAALGSGLDIGLPGGSVVVDIGGGTTDIALLSMNTPVLIESIRIAGERVDEAIVRYMRRRYNVLIGERTAELIKMQIGMVSPEPPLGSMDVTGRNLIDGLPRTVHVSAKEISVALEEPAAQIVEAIHSVLERTPPELSSDIQRRGIILTGGGALLTGLPRRVLATIKVPCTVADRPMECVALGIGRAMESAADYGDLVQGYRKPVRYDFKRL